MDTLEKKRVNSQDIAMMRIHRADDIGSEATCESTKTTSNHATTSPHNRAVGEKELILIYATTLLFCEVI